MLRFGRQRQSCNQFFRPLPPKRFHFIIAQMVKFAGVAHFQRLLRLSIASVQ